MTDKKECTSSLTTSGNSSAVFIAGSTNEVVGPFLIRHPQWDRNDCLRVSALGCDDAGRIYVAGFRNTVPQEFYLVRLLAEGSLGEGLAEPDPSFAEDGFALMSAGAGFQFVPLGAVQIVEINSTHLTVITEVLGDADTLYQVALCRFLTDGRADTTFGTGGVAMFAQLPAPSAPQRPVVSVSAGLTRADAPPFPSTNLLTNALQGTVFHETGADAGHASGTALPNGQILLIAHKRRPNKDKLSYLIKINADGTLDPTFAAGAGYIHLSFTGSTDATNYRMSADSAGRVVVISQRVDKIRCVATRFTANGLFDPAFGQAGFIEISSPTGLVNKPSIKTDGNGKIIISVCYQPATMTSAYQVYVFRLIEDGSPDPDFNNGHPVQVDLVERSKTDYQVYNIDIDEQQRVLLRGSYRELGVGVTIVSRCTEQGLDSSFGESGHYVLGRWGDPGNVAVQSGSTAVTFDRDAIWRLIAQAV